MTYIIGELAIWLAVAAGLGVFLGIALGRPKRDAARRATADADESRRATHQQTQKLEAAGRRIAELEADLADAARVAGQVPQLQTQVRALMHRLEQAPQSVAVASGGPIAATSRMPPPPPQPPPPPPASGWSG